MDMKTMLQTLDSVGSAEGTTQSSVATNGSMKSLLESLDSVVTDEAVIEGEMKDAVTDMQERLHDFAREIQMRMHGYDDVVDELNDMFDEVVDMGDPIVMNAFKVLRTLEPEDFGEGEGGGPNRASMVAQDAMDMIDGSDDSEYDHLPKIGEAADEEVVAEEELEEAVMVSAEGPEAAELLLILKNAGMPAAPVPAMPEPEMEMQDEYSNSPNEVEMDIDAVIASGDDLHREKDQFAAAADGDNPMKAFEGKFQSILDELLAEDADEATEEELEEAQSPAQKAAFEKMLAAKKGNKADDDDADEDDEKVDEATDETVSVTESAEFADMKHFMQRLNG